MENRFLSRLLGLLVLALLLAVAIGWSVRLVGESKLVAAQERFEAETGSLSLADYVLPVLDDDQNAAVWLRAGAESLQMSDGSTEVMAEVLENESEDWSQETHLAAAALIEANIGILETLEMSSGLEDSSFDFLYEEGFSAVTPPMLELYRLGRWIAVDHRLALAEGDFDRVARDLDILDQLSEALARESFLLSALMHLAVERLFLGAARDVVEVAIGDSEILDTLQVKLEGRSSANALRRGIAGEAAAVLDAASLRGRPADSTGRGEQLTLWLLEPFQLAALLDSYSEVVRSLEVPWIETLGHRQEEETEVSWSDHPFLLTNLYDVVEKLKAVELGQQLAAEALTLARVGIESGRLPASVDETTVDPYASGNVTYETSTDGGASLAAPEAIELWRSVHGTDSERQKPVFDFQLAAPRA